MWANSEVIIVQQLPRLIFGIGFRVLAGINKLSPLYSGVARDCGRQIAIDMDKDGMAKTAGST